MTGLKDATFCPGSRACFAWTVQFQTSFFRDSLYFSCRRSTGARRLMVDSWLLPGTRHCRGGPSDHTWETENRTHGKTRERNSIHYRNWCRVKRTFEPIQGMFELAIVAMLLSSSTSFCSQRWMWFPFFKVSFNTVDIMSSRNVHVTANETIGKVDVFHRGDASVVQASMVTASCGFGLARASGSGTGFGCPQCSQ